MGKREAGEGRRGNEEMGEEKREEVVAGGGGVVMTPEPIFIAIAHVQSCRNT